jgi:uncharacterized protein YabN with tetrapyrrole methylase and pyrophosphatase domain
LRKAQAIGLALQFPGDASVDDERALADALAALAAAGARAGIDGESALTAWAGRFKDRFARMEQLALAEHVDLAAADASTVQALWDRAEAP